MHDTGIEEAIKSSNLIQEAIINHRAVQKEIFEKKTQKERLLDFIKARHYCRTSTIQQWGLDNWTTRADRTARDLCAEGRIRRIRKEEKEHLFGSTKEEVYEFVR